MKITKSNSTKQSFNPNKILKRVEDQSKNLNVNPTIVAQKVIVLTFIFSILYQVWGIRNFLNQN